MADPLCLLMILLWAMYRSSFGLREFVFQLSHNMPESLLRGGSCLSRFSFEMPILRFEITFAELKELSDIMSFGAGTYKPFENALVGFCGCAQQVERWYAMGSTYSDLGSIIRLVVLVLLDIDRLDLQFLSFGHWESGRPILI